ncbi:hypothetical protein [Mucilaginibacter flavus]|uniref:hypothetical protein n=1 Tax=Mucilaginibacter flavus TaxID=931504 RepID=UPI0025B382F4|nr:hypothetical protein [Mucilaginibacter flavus]MDN3583963.1 hypothetical protein [Mucilaginibacter flavus]
MIYLIHRNYAAASRRFLLLSAVLVCVGTSALAQDKPSAIKSDKSYSDAKVVYDFKNPETKVDIPFDQRFTFSVIHFNTAGIKRVFAYEAIFKNGIRDLKADVKDSTGQPSNLPDVELNKYAHGDTLDIYFVPLKPSIEFDIAVTRSLGTANLALLYQVNELLYAGNYADARQKFSDLEDATYDSVFNLSFFSYDFDTYRAAFVATFHPAYVQLHDATQFPDGILPDMIQINRLEMGFVQNRIHYKDGCKLTRVVLDHKITELFKGFVPADYTVSTDQAAPEDYGARIKNLKQSISIFEALDDSCRSLLARDNSAAFLQVRAMIAADLAQLKTNKDHIEKYFGQLNKAIQADAHLAEVSLLVGTTYAKDIKTQGSNIFTLDLGLSFMNAWNYRNQAAFLPKLYWGVNIYFRPINKSMRQETLPHGLKPDLVNGPDYHIVDQASGWQHFSMTLGFTTGTYSNTDFDNLFNNTTLLTGFGYRFYRAFKFSLGTAWLRRTSNNPVITGKGLCFAPYASLSVDIDLIQNLKDIYTMIMK